ncbi:MAG: hypothetical protein GY771_04655 [bacterium]|nr:hypothetical protein [bacterium]
MPNYPIRSYVITYQGEPWGTYQARGPISAIRAAMREQWGQVEVIKGCDWQVERIPDDPYPPLYR